MQRALLIVLGLLVLGCGRQQNTGVSEAVDSLSSRPKPPYLLVLGTAQDAGAPQVGCSLNCCRGELRQKNPLQVVSLALVDEASNSWILFEATPDITQQIDLIMDRGLPPLPCAVFITHAHIGHYTGLMYFGREGYAANGLRVYAMPRMQNFLANNGPWDQLITLKNISLKDLVADRPVQMGNDISIQPFLVPHRDEYSETVGYKIQGPNHSAIFIPDIDKWNIWERDINALIKEVDYAFLDATFYSGEELPNRTMSEIPHPFIVESLQRFDAFSKKDREKIQFLHFNHSNPLIDPGSKAYQSVTEKGYGVARIRMEYPL